MVAGRAVANLPSSWYPSVAVAAALAAEAQRSAGSFVVH
jgi:hypothetical protein